MNERQQDDRTSRRRRLLDKLANPRATAGRDPLRHLARAVTDSSDPDVTCEECRSQLPAFVDAEVGGLPASVRYPAVKRHLDLCAACAAEYQTLLALALAEDSGAIVAPDVFPMPDLTFLAPRDIATLVRHTMALARDLIAAINPKLAPDLDAVAEGFLERVQALGGAFALRQGAAGALDLGAGEAADALKLLAATYAATRSLTDDLSAAQIAALIQSGQLPETLRRYATQAARESGFSRQEQKVFVAEYVRRASRDPMTLQSLAAPDQR